jgi:urease accessory protein
MAIPLARRFAPPDSVVDEILHLAFDQRERSRFRARLLSGDEIGVDLPPGTLIRHGQKLALDDGRVVGVEAADEPLMEVVAADAAELARIAYHIGNRHVPLQIGERWLRLLPDHVLRAMVERLGAAVHDVTAGFQPESGAYGHSHVHHQHDDQGHGGRIHVFDARHDHDHRHEHEHDPDPDPDHEHDHEHQRDPRNDHPAEPRSRHPK